MALARCAATKGTAFTRANNGDDANGLALALNERSFGGVKLKKDTTTLLVFSSPLKDPKN